MSISKLPFRPTAKSVVLSAFAGLCGWAGKVFGIFAFYSFALVLATVVFVGFLSALYGRRGHWSIVRELTPAQVQVGDPITVSISAQPVHRRAATAVLIENTPWGLRRLGLAATVTARSTLPPQSASWDVPTTHRGRFGAGPGELVRADLFGLFRRRLASVAESERIVWPLRVSLNLSPLVTFFDRSAAGTDRYSDSATAIRPYTAGDDPRTVNWKLSARTMSTGSLMVGIPEREALRRKITVQLDVGGLSFVDALAGEAGIADRELALSSAASLLSALSAANNIDSALVISKGTGVVHRSDILSESLTALAVIEELLSERDSPPGKPASPTAAATAAPTQTSNAMVAATRSIVVTGPLSTVAGDLTIRCGSLVGEMADSTHNPASALDRVLRVQTLADLTSAIEGL
jgi:uncharacterized protein (DUF58 family)